MKKGIVIIILSTIVFSMSHEVNAGLLDKISAATQKLNMPAGMDQTTTSQKSPYALQGQGHCKGQNTATCLDYMEVMDQCMDPLKGYRSKLYVDLIGKKLQTEILTNQQRKNLEEDLAAFKEAVNNKTDNIKMANPKDSQRYLMDVTEDDQDAVNTEYAKKSQEIMNKCEGADHMGVGHRTELGYGGTNDAPSKNTELQAMKKRHREHAMAGQAAMSGLQECMKGITALRWKLLGDKMEAKMKSINLSAQDRKDWEADLASVREAEQKNSPNITPANPAQPARYLQRLSTQDHMEINQEYMKASSELMTKCNASAQAQMNK